MQKVTSTEFQQNVGTYTDLAMREPIIVTSHNRERFVLMDIDIFKRLRSMDTREAFFPHELDDDIKNQFEKGYQGKKTPHLDHLLD